MKKLLFYSTAALLLSTGMSGCTFYKYTFNKTQERYNPDTEKRWRMLDNENILVVHYENELKEIYNVAYNDKTKTVKGNLRPFEGKGLYYYDKVMRKNGGIAKSKARYSEYNTTKQVHFFMKQVEKPDSNTMQFSIADINQIDASEHATGLNILLPIGMGAVAAGTFLLIACNCPHVYVDNGTELELTNSMYTGAKAPQLERFDYKQLPDYFADSSFYTVNIVNELNEDQYTNMLELMVAVHPKDMEVIADKNGALHTIQNPQLPIHAEDNGRTDIMKELASADEVAYKFNADSNSTFSEAYLQFAVPAQQPSTGKLLIRLRNTPWSGYVYHEFSSLFGKNYSKWMAYNKDKSKEEREQWMREQGIRLQVEIKTEQGWQTAGEVDLVGETNFNSLVIPIELPSSSKKLEVRLRTGFMFWELDYAAMDFSPNEKIEMQVLKPSKAVGESGQDYVQALSYDDALYMEHLGVKSSTKVTFTALHTNPDLKRTLILRSKGYYTSKETFAGKTYRKELKKFKEPGELSKFSRQLYEEVKRTAMK